MLKIAIPLAAVSACLLLSACSEKPAEAPAPQAEAPKKSLARQVQFYQGQENVQAITSGSVKPVAGGGYDLEAKATTDGAGWTKVGFLPRVYAATPPDGIYEVDVVADKPATPSAAGGPSPSTRPRSRTSPTATSPPSPCPAAPPPPAG